LRTPGILQTIAYAKKPQPKQGLPSYNLADED
jgi:hypothetical protein